MSHLRFVAAMQGFVVGFVGAKLHCLHHGTMQTLVAPHTVAMHEYLARSNVAMAYKVCLISIAAFRQVRYNNTLIG